MLRNALVKLCVLTLKLLDDDDELLDDEDDNELDELLL
jgi:hypothetical protein